MKPKNDQLLMRRWLGLRSSWRWLLFFCALAGGPWAGFSLSPITYGAQDPTTSFNSLVPIVRQAEKVDLSPLLRSMQPAQPESHVTDPATPRVMRLGRRPIARSAAAAMDTLVPADPVVQNSVSALKTPAPTIAFEGVSNADNISINSFSVLPPDPVGDVGPDHYVQLVNNLFQVFNKSGAPLLPSPIPISALYTGFGGPCETTNDGDGIVLYDHLADRWLISQFANAFFGPPFHQCIAISQTADPTGAYFLYDFPMPNSKFNDYPKFGVWPDAYYMSDNQFAPPAFNFAGVGVFAFERDKMLTGDPMASFIYFDLAVADPLIFGMLPADLDGPAPPPGTPNYFAYLTAGEFGDPQGDGLRIFEFHADFATPGSPTFNERSGSPLATAPFNPVICPVFFECISQRGTKVKLDSLADRLMFRLQYRNFGTHASLVTNHTVNGGAGKAGVRYYELRATPPGGNFVVNEQATFAPDGNHRWMGSAAMDVNGSIAVGYSVSGAMLFPSIRYASRLASDPPGGLFQGEATLQKGGGSQTDPNSGERWGDYSALSVDPVQECTFWYTQEYYATTSNRGWQTKIGSFRLPGCIHDLAVVKMTANATVKGAGPVTAGVAVKVQNRSDHPETIDSVDLGDGVATGLVRLSVSVVDDDVESCQVAGVVLDGAKNAALFSGGAIILKPKKFMTVSFLVTYQCTNAQPLNKSDPTRGDYDHVTTVHHDVLDGNLDDHAADDSCPHDGLPGNLDSNPPPKGVKDKGCGKKKPDGTLGAPVQTDVIQ